VEKWRRLVRHRRVHGYFENSINLAPPLPVLLSATHPSPSPSFSLLPLSVSPHTSTDRPRASERWNFLVVPISRYSRGVLGRDPIYPGLSAPKAPIATPALLIWPESTFCPLRPACTPPLPAYIAYHLFRRQIPFIFPSRGYDLDPIKELTRNGRDGEMVNKRVRFEIHDDEELHAMMMTG